MVQKLRLAEVHYEQFMVSIIEKWSASVNHTADS